MNFQLHRLRRDTAMLILKIILSTKCIRIMMEFGWSTYLRTKKTVNIIKRISELPAGNKILGAEHHKSPSLTIRQ